ncbi:hypothetical protein DSO57_1018375 [Entomophthora muscae]|uniref:Uncharacterized protein n=1 Tax=Entomophthora muscae TaxID=34485 RepID=A0ACC2T4R2_9FUNG|nr:hypothetical protein DSO57_1018375 [Entomophthora muscae]
MASSEFSNLDEPITPDNTMEVDSANILINDCNLAGPITPNNAMEVDSPNVLINKCNLNEPIIPLNAMETDTPNMGQSDLAWLAQKLLILTKLVVLPQATQSDPAMPRKPMHPIYLTIIAILLGQSDLAQLTQIIFILTKKVALFQTSQSNPVIPRHPMYKRDPHWLDQFSSNSSEPMDTFHTPPEWFDPFWVAINQPRMDGKSQVTSDVKQTPPKSGKKHRGPNQSDGPKERPGLSAVKILCQLMMTISLKDLCTESPKFCQKMHQAISTLRPGK